MSELRVTKETVNEILPHDNADRLENASILGWNCVVGKDSLKAGDEVIYFPIDVVLSEKLEAIIFATSKVQLTKRRIRTVKLRGCISQGLAVPVSSLVEDYPDIASYKVGKNMAEYLGVTKYEPKMSEKTRGVYGKTTSSKKNPHFKRYTNINHGKNYPNAVNNLDVVITEKIHGTNFRAGWVPITGNIFQRVWKRFKNLVTFAPFAGYEFVIGSHNVQIKQKKQTYDFNRKGNVYLDMAKKYDLKRKMNKGEVMYGEIYGDGIQKNYSYGLKNEVNLIGFDVMKDGKYVSHHKAGIYFDIYGVTPAPVLFTGRFGDGLVDDYVGGRSVLSSDQKHREGIVIKTLEELNGPIGRMIFKYINPEYLLLKNNTEHH